MGRFRESVVVDQPPDAVFASITDQGRISEWNDHVQRAEVVGGGPVDVGSRLRQHRRRNKRDFALDFVVTASQAPPVDLTFGFHTAVVGFGATPGVDHDAVDIEVVLPAGETEGSWLRKECERGLLERYQTLTDEIRHRLDYELAFTASGKPFLTTPGRLVDAAHESIFATAGLQPALSTGGGTSDGRFIADICPELVELGPVNATIHKLNERVAVDELEPLSRIYGGILQRLLA